MDQMMDVLIHQLSVYVGEDYTEEQEPFLRILLNDALDEVMAEMYPYELPDNMLDAAKEKALKRYGSTIRKIAQYHYDKQGKEGLILWIENGVHSTYENAGTPKSYLRGIIPVSVIV